VQDDVARRNGNGIAHAAVTASGTLVYASGAQESLESLYWQDAAGKTEALRAPPNRGYYFPRISPDGLRIAVRIGNSITAALGVYEWAENRMTRVSAQFSPTQAIWAPDDKHLAVQLVEGTAGPGIYWVRADGAGQAELLVGGEYTAPSNFSRDGKRLAYWKLGRTSDPGLWTVFLDLTDPEHPKPGKPESFLRAKVQVSDPVFSPDGRWIAYTSAESGGQEIVVRPFPGPGGKWQVSTGGGTTSVWPPDGHQLLYLEGHTVMAVPYAVKGDAFSAGQPRAWSLAPIRTASGTPPEFDLSPDGKRIVAAMPASAASPADQPPGVAFLFNFADELGRKAPSKR
jgi:serine/threonine-protein kinase